MGINSKALHWASVVCLVLSACSKTPATSQNSSAPPAPSGPVVGNWPAPTFQYTAPTPSQAWTAGQNQMSITVNGSLCGDPNSQYANEPCVSITICAPGTSQCQTIDNILLDTGSVGLRLFSSVVTVSLPGLTSSGYNLAECVQFADGSSQWGPISIADVKLGNEPAVTLPIQLINSNYSSAPSPCTTAESSPDTDPAQAGFNGILGIGLFANDCDSYCASNGSNGQYYSCSSTACAGALVLAGAQATNPVSAQTVDNNGVILKLPSVPTGGAPSLDGTLVLGIDTQANNASTSSGAKTYSADGNGQFTTVFSAFSTSTLTGFLDSGSSVYFIPSPKNGSLPDCDSSAGGSRGSDYSGFFCPSSTVTLSATNYSAVGSLNGSTALSIGNAYSLFNSNNSVFRELGATSGSDTSAVFDWGLPFFYGKNVYVGIQDQTSKLGTGPYWAY